MINCPSCQAQLRPTQFNTGRPEPCPLCSKKVQVLAFAALGVEKKEMLRSEALVDDQAGCFFHAEKKATTVCEICGRFICALCDLDINGTHMCPHCLETGKEKGSIETLDNTRVLYDRMAIYVAFFSFFLNVISGILAPITFYIIIRHWKTPGSVTQTSGGKIRFVFAGLLALTQVLITFLFFYNVLTE